MRREKALAAPQLVGIDLLINTLTEENKQLGKHLAGTRQLLDHQLRPETIAKETIDWQGQQRLAEVKQGEGAEKAEIVQIAQIA